MVSIMVLMVSITMVLNRATKCFGTDKNKQHNKNHRKNESKVVLVVLDEKIEM